VDQRREERRCVTKDLSDGPNGAHEIVDVHVRHLTRGAVEGASIPPVIEFRDVAHSVFNRWCLGAGFRLRLGDHRLGEVQSKDVGTSTSKFPGSATGTAGDIEPPLTVQTISKKARRAFADQASVARPGQM
jgi:hypothetical protein